MGQRTSNEFLGISKNKKYIISKDLDEAASFDSYGVMENIMSSGSAIALCSYLKPIDIVSLVGDPTTDMCEIYWNGQTAMVDSGYLEVYYSLSDVSKCEFALPMRISHEEEYTMQILIPFKKGIVSKNYIDNCLSCKLNWSNL